MTPERWQQVKNTLAAALDRPGEQERDEFLSDACGEDTELRREVDSLLAQSGDEFESLAEVIGVAGTNTSLAADTGRRLGNYELIREIGRGGMGAVWLARRADQQFEKLVAIKLLKRGTDTDEVLRRFQTERQILARLEHPNIARLLDGGVTDDGLPYFVMEYVEGQQVTDFCQQRALPMEDRLRLFLKICGAVQFAHQNLIVHRDLKPGNILVAADGEPKLLDFGIAKLLAADDAMVSVTVAEHQRLTPAYASPEQVRGEPITTVSDVYTLGTLLYELLTGQSAHRFSVPHPPPTELLRVVAQEEPLRPSTAAANSKIENRKSKFLRGDLDNIVLKALRKEPARRYPGVGSFAADIERYLGHQPITARKDTVAYRAAKFIQRNKIGFVGAALVVLTLIGGIIGIAWEARQANRRFTEVRTLAHSVLFDYHDAIAELPGSTSVREKLARDSFKYLDSLAREAGNDRSLQREIAAAYLKLGDVEGQPNLPNLGHMASALDSYRKALAVWERLAAQEPGDVEAACKLATVHSRLGELLRDKADLVVAVEHNRKAVAIMESVVARGNSSPDVREALAWAYTTLGDVLGNPLVANLGDVKGAKENYDRALALREQLMTEYPSSWERRKWAAVAHQRVGTMLQATNDLPGAMQHFRQGLEIDEALLKEDPLNAYAQRAVAVDCTYLSLAAFGAGDIEAAKKFQARNIEMVEQLLKADPRNDTAQRGLISSYAQMLYLTGRSGDMAGATEYMRKALAMAKPLVESDPTNFGNLATVRGVDERMADLLLRAEDGKGALPYAREELEIIEKMFALQPSNTNVRRSQAATHGQLGRAYKLIASHAPEGAAEALENWRNARAEFQQSLDIYTELKAKGALVGSEPARIEQMSGEIAKCEAALNAKAPNQTP